MPREGPEVDRLRQTAAMENDPSGRTEKGARSSDRLQRRQDSSIVRTIQEAG